MEIEDVFIETEMIKAWNVNFSKKRGVLKNMEFEVVFTETEMIIAWNVNFLWIKRSGKKKYGDWSCIFRDRNDQSLKR